MPNPTLRLMVLLNAASEAVHQYGSARAAAISGVKAAALRYAASRLQRDGTEGEDPIERLFRMADLEEMEIFRPSAVSDPVYERRERSEK